MGGSSVGVLSVVILVFSGVSLARGVQRMYRDAWQFGAGSPAGCVGGSELMLTPGRAFSPTKDEVALGGRTDHGRVGTSEQFENPPDAPPPSREAILVLDAAVGASLLAAAAARAVGRRVGGALSPVAVVILRPPMLAQQYQAGTWLATLARRGGRGRQELEHQLSVGLDRIVPTVSAAMLKRIDLAGVAEGVIAEVDLAEIIRQSSESVASDTVRGVRMQGISGDEAVGRVVGRLRLRLGRKEPEMTSTQP